MALKTKVKRESVVSEEDGNVEWITDTGKMMKAPAISVQIIEAPASPAEVVEQAGAGEASEPEAEATEDAPVAPPPTPKKEKAPPKAKAAAKAPAAKPAKAATPAPAAPAPEKIKPQKAEKPSSTVKENVVAKAKAKAKNAPKGARTIGGKEVDLSKYNKVKAPGGGVSFNNGDSTAKKLEGKTLDEVYKIVAKDTKQDEKELRAKYKHLNPGMQRMSLGNMHRKGPREAKAAKKS